MTHTAQLGVVLAVSFVAGSVNAVAGGGTNLTFPTLVWLGLPPVSANASNAVGLWPSSFGGALGFRREIARVERAWLWLVLPALFGGMLGAWLLINTPARFFGTLAPYLVLASSLLLAVEPALRRYVGVGADGRWRRLLAVVTQFAIALYGGYFGAGIGIMLLIILGLLGIHNIHHANGLKNIFTIAIKGVAVLYFAMAGPVVWTVALTMAGGALLGGWGGAAAGRRLGERRMRTAVVLIGLAMAVLMLLHIAE